MTCKSESLQVGRLGFKFCITHTQSGMPVRSDGGGVGGGGWGWWGVAPRLAPGEGAQAKAPGSRQAAVQRALACWPRANGRAKLAGPRNGHAAPEHTVKADISMLPKIHKGLKNGGEPAWASGI